MSDLMYLLWFADIVETINAICNIVFVVCGLFTAVAAFFVVIYHDEYDYTKSIIIMIRWCCLALVISGACAILMPSKLTMYAGMGDLCMEKIQKNEIGREVVDILSIRLQRMKQEEERFLKEKK